MIPTTPLKIAAAVLGIMVIVAAIQNRLSATTVMSKNNIQSKMGLINTIDETIQISLQNQGEYKKPF